MIIVTSLVGCLLCWQDLSVDKLLASHKQYLSQYRTVDAEIETWVSWDDGGSWKLLARDQWWRDGSQERGTRWTAAHHDKFFRTEVQERFEESSYSDHRILSLDGLDPRKKLTEAPSVANNNLGIRASLTELATEEDSTVGGPILLLLRGAMVDDLARASRLATSSKVSQTETDGRILQTVELTTKVPFAYSLKYTMDPAKGFAPVERRLNMSATAFSEAKVLAYQHEEGDLWVPSRVQMRMSDRPGQILEYRLTKLRLNKPIDRSLLKTPISEGMMVRSKNLIHIWGKDGPKQSVENLNDLLQIKKNQ